MEEKDLLALAEAAGVQVHGGLFEIELGADAEDGEPLVPGKPFRVYRIGEEVCVDGRKVNVTTAAAKFMADDFNKRPTDLAVTYDHEKDRARGSEAAGWVKKLEARADGVWATLVSWTRDAAKLIREKKFRFCSGDALGYRENGVEFPLRMLAISLVPKPAIEGLGEITCSADKRKALCAKHGLKEDATDEELLAAMIEKSEPMAEEKAETEKTEKSEPEHIKTCSTKTAADTTAAKGGIEMEPETKAPGGGAPASVTMTREELDRLVADAAGKAAENVLTSALPKITKEANEKATATVTASFKKAELDRKVAEQLLAMETDGRITAAERQTYSAQLSENDGANFDFLVSIFEKLPKKAPVGKSEFRHGAEITSTGRTSAQEFDRMTHGQKGEFLSRVFAYKDHLQITYGAAFGACLEDEDRGFRSTPWEKKAENFRFGARNAQVDPDVVKKVQEVLKAGKIPTNLISEQAQMTFAAISNFQPGARTTLPMAAGFVQAPFVGSDASLEFVGGEDERCAWPEFSTEQYEIDTEPTGMLESPSSSSFGVKWHTEDIDVYADDIMVDRRSRVAGVTLPIGVDAISSEQANVKSGTRKEYIQAKYLRTAGSYAAGHSTTLTSTAQWSDASNSDPITLITNAMAKIRKACGRFPDTFVLGADVFMALRRNLKIIEAVKYTGTLGAPGQIVPIQTLVALFGITILVAESRYSLAPGGTSPSDCWGQDAMLLVTSPGEVVAPRFSMTVVAKGYPKVRTYPREDVGANGADVIAVSNAYAIKAVNNTCGYLWVDASAAL